MTMEHDFDEIISRTGTHSVKWDHRVEHCGRSDVLPMWVADMDFRSPPAVRTALKRAVEHGVFGYTARSERYERAIRGWLFDRHGWGVDPEWILYSPGVMPGVSYAIQAFSEPGDKVIVQSPVYPPFFGVIRENDRRVGENPLVLVDDHYQMDMDDLERQLAEDRTRILLLCSPHNPVGRVWHYKELERVGELCEKHDVLIISDEIHGDIVYPGAEHVPVASLDPDFQEITVTLTGPGKTFNVQGLISAFAVIPNDDLRKAFERVLKRNWVTLENALSIYACEVAYEEGAPWLDELLTYLNGNRAYLLDHIQDHCPGIRAIQPEGTYVAWLDCRELGLDDNELRDFFVDEAGVCPNSGVTFGAPGSGFMRLNFGCPRARLREGLDRISAALQARWG